MKTIAKDGKEVKYCDVCTYQYKPEYFVPAIGTIDCRGIEYCYCAKHEVEAKMVLSPQVRNLDQHHENI